MSDHLGFCRDWRGGYFSVQTSGCNDVTGFYVDFVNGPRYPISWREFPLLQTTFDVNVLALLVRHRQVGDFVVKDQAVPVRVGLRFPVTPRKMIRLAETEIHDLRARRKISKLWRCGQISSEFDAVLLHTL